ncbi:fatty-acid peroxygenase [Salinibacillus kushneri]|uniref:Fatty-acid peroxygenase n=1 Tax=Salinibacillus kushneri TaxID=237682 RepID=A0A1I0DTQ9_9BACI|nr:cytochrome P450 [Salinibacillus kushneri]SET35850.1 fatty-acid peroxygenase [Salinibacillus kushneri]
MESNEHIPKEQGPDHSLSLLQDGYLFIKNRVEQYDSDIFETRILGKKVVCMSGADAVKVFYDPNRFQRKWAAPYRIQQTLFGVGAIQGMDGEAHRKLKNQYLSLMTVPEQKRISELMTQELQSMVSKWELADRIILFEEMKVILCRIACQWAGVPLQEEEVSDIADDLIAMIYAFGRVGPEHWKGRSARNRTENWMKKIIDEVRAGNLTAEPQSALYAMAFYKDHNDQIVHSKKAAIELLNVIRPIVAISTYITFSAVALHENPETKNWLQSGGMKELEMFTNEVRRFYPFGPFLGARVKQDFTWKNYDFKKGTLVLLDIYGLNHNQQIWENPNQFNPNHFNNWEENPYTFIPQGGGDPANGHRCPGEGITIEVLKVSLDFLVNKIDYEVPAQDLNYSLDEMPTLPKSGFIMTKVRRK